MPKYVYELEDGRCLLQITTNAEDKEDAQINFDSFIESLFGAEEFAEIEHIEEVKK